MDIPIVVVAYNRDNTLKRILSSLSKAHYPGEVKLIISIDGGGPGNVIQTAKKIVWEHGQKEIVEHNRNLGLRRHILSCGAISQEYDGIVLLEDDLYVSPWFYDYALKASKIYQECSEISGISLYSPRYNEAAFLPFYPLNDGSDAFFMQSACSWGQIWLREQWREFETWYASGYNNQVIDLQTLPTNVQIWPESSWKKYFIQYMILNKKYFVYPRHSYTTNFGDKGQHHNDVKTFQVPLVSGPKKTFDFVQLKDAIVKYDAFYEIEPDCIKRLSDDLSAYEFVVDLYGTKERHHFDKSYVITSKECSKFSKSFDKALLPIECNVIESIQGFKLFLAKVEDVNVDINVSEDIVLKANDINEHKYHYAINDFHFQIKNQESELYISKIKEIEESLRLAEEYLQLILNSYSFRVGKKIILPFSLMKRFFNRVFGKN